MPNEKGDGLATTTVSILVEWRKKRCNIRFGIPQDTLGRLAPFQLRE